MDEIKTFREVGQVAEGIFNGINPVETLEGRKQVASIGADRYFVPSSLKRLLTKRAAINQKVTIKFRGMSKTGRYIFDVVSDVSVAAPSKKSKKKEKEDKPTEY